ncbi:hypothetical protein D3C87_2018370 [compost metagenome]
MRSNIRRLPSARCIVPAPRLNISWGVASRQAGGTTEAIISTPLTSRVLAPIRWPSISIRKLRTPLRVVLVR